MSLRDGAYFKSKRLQDISKEIAKRLSKGKKLNFEGFVTWIEFNIGLTDKKAREYIKLTCKTHHWHLDKNGFLVLEQENS